MIIREKFNQLHWREGKSQREIACEFGCSRGKLCYWINRFGIPHRSRLDAITITPRLVPSKDMAYVLGVLKGDGCVYIGKNGYGSIILGQTRAEFAVSFEIALKNIGLNPHTYIRKPRKVPSHSYNIKPMFVTQCCSIKFAQWYKGLSFENIGELIGDNLDFLRAFIRGFYESEGCNSIHHFIRKSNNRKCCNWVIRISGMGEELYDLIEQSLNKLGFRFRRYRRRNWRGKEIHILESGIQQQSYRFIKEIAPCIKNQVIENPAQPLEKWSKARVIHDIRKFVEEKGFLPIARDDENLTGAAIRHFGTWNNAKRSAGLEVHRQPPKYQMWSKEKVIKELQTFVEVNGFSPSRRKIPITLLSACERYFGSWTRAKEAAGIEVYRNKWSKERILNELGNFVAINGVSPSVRFVPNSLSGACKRHFGSWNAAKRVAGMDVYSNNKAKSKGDVL